MSIHSYDPETSLTLHCININSCFHTMCAHYSARQYKGHLLLCRYDFTDGDLGVCLTQMRMFLDEYADIPFRVLRFLVTEINYGGRVTDDKDRRLINNLVTGFVGPQVLDPRYNFSASGTALKPSSQSLCPGTCACRPLQVLTHKE